MLAAHEGAILGLAQELLGSTYPQGFAVPPLKLSELGRTRTYGKYPLNMVLREERLADDNDPAAQARLQMMRANIKVTVPVKGSFSPDEGITLYLCNICAYCQQHGLNVEDYCVSVLAHELFHALHHAACAAAQGLEPGSAKLRAYWRGEGYIQQQVAAVREGLAEYFRCQWSKRQGYEAVLARLHCELAEPYAVVPGYPYAAVKALLTADGDAKFRAVWERSLVDWGEGVTQLSLAICKKFD